MWFSCRLLLVCFCGVRLLVRGLVLLWILFWVYYLCFLVVVVLLWLVGVCFGCFDFSGGFLGVNVGVFSCCGFSLFSVNRVGYSDSLPGGVVWCYSTLCCFVCVSCMFRLIRVVCYAFAICGWWLCVCNL